jgi:antitoxin (DNA-binding transcriptional repressor) of toxin-antitoxin stability system
MKAVAIRELKSRLSSYLRDVSSGEVILVTDRGRVVAELRKPSLGAVTNPVEAELERMVAAGELSRGLPNDPSVYRMPKARVRRTTSKELLEQDRSENDRLR